MCIHECGGIVNITFSLIKPDSMKSCEEILAAIKAGGFSVVAMRTEMLSKKQVEQFYKEHADKSFFNTMCERLASGVVLLIALHRIDGSEAPLNFRKLLGATNPKDAAPGTLRAQFGEDLDRNAIHGSDSRESAIRELSLFFPGIQTGIDLDGV